MLGGVGLALSLGCGGLWGSEEGSNSPELRKVDSALWDAKSSARIHGDKCEAIRSALGNALNAQGFAKISTDEYGSEGLTVAIFQGDTGLQVQTTLKDQEELIKGEYIACKK